MVRVFTDLWLSIILTLLRSQITYSEMYSGTWMIIIQADNVNFQVVREFKLTVQAIDKTTVTATPTVVVGVTSRQPDISPSPLPAQKTKPSPLTFIPLSLQK